MNQISAEELMQGVEKAAAKAFTECLAGIAEERGLGPEIAAEIHKTCKTTGAASFGMRTADGKMDVRMRVNVVGPDYGSDAEIPAEYKDEILAQYIVFVRCLSAYWAQYSCENADLVSRLASAVGKQIGFAHTPDNVLTFALCEDSKYRLGVDVSGAD